MRNILELTKREQRVVIVIVTLLVVAGFAKHAWQTRSSPPLKTSPTETTSPSHHEKPESPHDAGD